MKNQIHRDNIVGKNILLLIEPFYGYGELIEKELLRLGAKSVYRKVSVFFSTFRDKITLNTFKNLILHPRARYKWTESFKTEIKDRHFDTLFVIENLPFTKEFISFIDTQNPGIRKILFLWDTFSTQQPRYFDYLPLFDTVYSFDRGDAKKYNLRYYPDFYIDVPRVPIDDCTYDISFIGTMNHVSTFFRGELLRKISEQCDKQKLKTFFYLKHYPLEHESRFAFWRNLLHREMISYRKEVKRLKNFGFLYDTPLDLNNGNNIQSNSKIMLDLSHLNRQGLTINAITALATGKKLITTNYFIKEEEFYDPKIISVIDVGNPIIDLDFICSQNTPIDMSYLRLDNWLKHIVNEEP